MPDREALATRGRFVREGLSQPLGEVPQLAHRIVDHAAPVDSGREADRKVEIVALDGRLLEQSLRGPNWAGPERIEAGGGEEADPAPGGGGAAQQVGEGLGGGGFGVGEAGDEGGEQGEGAVGGAVFHSPIKYIIGLALLRISTGIFGNEGAGREDRSRTRPLSEGGAASSRR